MGSEEKHKGKGFLIDLLAKATEVEGLDIVRLRDEIRKEIEAENKTFGKFLGLVESLQDIISEERQRYNAAIKALSKTSGLSRQNILEAADSQIEELKMLEKGVMSALPDIRDELKTMESRSKEINNEIAKLSEKISQLRKEEQKLLDGIAVRTKDMKAIEGAVGKIFTGIGSEITGIRKKIEEFAAEKAPSQPVRPPDVVESHRIEEDKGGIEGESVAEWVSEPEETEAAEKCPMCGGRMDFNMQYGMWMCYACGHEEPVKDSTEDASELTAAAEPAPSAEQKPVPVESGPFSVPSATAPPVKRAVSKKKPCPVCRKQMDWIEKEKTWRCPACNYQRMVF